MTAQDLQNIINEWANLGWTLDRLTSGETQGLMHGINVFLLIFKREVELPDGLHILKNGQQIAVNSNNFLSLRQQGLINPQTQAIKKGDVNWQTLGFVAPEIIEVVLMTS